MGKKKLIKKLADKNADIRRRRQIFERDKILNKLKREKTKIKYTNINFMYIRPVKEVNKSAYIMSITPVCFKKKTYRFVFESGKMFTVPKQHIVSNNLLFKYCASQVGEGRWSFRHPLSLKELFKLEITENFDGINYKVIKVNTNRLSNLWHVQNLQNQD